jgi:gas vesicle protein
MAKKSNAGGVGKALVVGAGVAVASAAAYLLMGPEGKKNRKQIKGWTIKMKGEMIEKLEGLKEVTEPMYHKIVDDISAKYAKLRDVDQADVEQVVDEVKRHWKALVKDSKKVAKKVSKKVSKK